MTGTASARPRVSPVVLILAATAISGGSGYLVLGLAAAFAEQPGAAFNYTNFSYFWSALYLVIGASGGVQQEITRATSPDSGAVDVAPAGKPARLLVFALTVAAGLFVVLAATGPFWSARLFGDAGLGLIVPLALGAAAYILVASLCGALYGIVAWKALAVMIAIDGVIRLGAVGAVLLLGGGLDLLAWAVVLPFPAAIAIVAPWVAKRLRRDIVVDVPAGRLGWNVARTVVGSAATASIISGFPVLLGFSSPDTSAATLAPLLLALTLTRAPIVIPLLALQSYLIVQFRANAGAVLRRFALLEAGVGVVALAATLLAYFFGPQVIALIWTSYDIERGMLAIIVASSALVAGLCVSGPALIAASRHLPYLAGWVVAAVGTVVALFLPFDLETRVASALLVGPVLVLAVHTVAIVRAAKARETEPDALG